MDIKFSHAKSKVKSLADNISNAIMQGRLRMGSNLLSINEASDKYNVSRDTVFKAYKELKYRGLVESNPTKGYYVKGEVNHILLLLDTYSPFKQYLYKRLVTNLPSNYKVDLIFHQYNEHLFETIVRESIGKYSMYLVMNFSNEHFSPALKGIPSDRLLLLDFGAFPKANYSYICQDFDKSLFYCLKTAKDVLRKYTKLVYVFPEEVCHPISSVHYFKTFCDEEHFDFEVIRKDIDQVEIQKGTMYLCILQEDLVKIIKKSDTLNFEIGTDIGLLAYNENPMLEVIKGGISSISIDFGMMGEMAATFVNSKKPVTEFLPTTITLRASL